MRSDPKEIILNAAPSAEDIVRHLTEAVHEHRVLPGMKLSEDEVGEVFGVSRTIVRQALRSMAHEGLVTIERNRGAFVAKPTIKEAREVFEARALLEPQTARSASERTTGADIALLERHIEQEHAALAAGQAGRALKLSGLFHLEIARIADQKAIEGFLQQLIARSSLVIALYWQRRNALCESHAHRALIDALRDKDADKAEDLMKGHLVDLLSQLNLRETAKETRSLKEALRSGG
ncbi:MAG: GntR family transcriptional regulator [Pseudomonadota bacterium]